MKAILFAMLITAAVNFNGSNWQYSASAQQVDYNLDVYTTEGLRDVEEVYSDFDYSTVVNEYISYLPGYTITRFKNFVIFSNLDEETTYSLINTDIRNTADGMAGSYLELLPENVTGVFLFSDKESYVDFSVNKLGMIEKDLSPYGFYKISKNVIALRYISWKGTLPHEITHAMIQADFPDMPSWLNEGLAALHETTLLRNGELIGTHNHRINSIKRAIRNNTYTDLRHLLNTEDSDIYSTKGTYYYAQARYLLGYLQELGLLKLYYKHFNTTFEEDQSGLSQLEYILNKPIEEIEEDYLNYILSIE